MGAPPASRPALLAGALAGLFVGGAALTGCGARTPELWSVNEDQVAATLDYDDALRTWTRSAESYEAFESRVFVTATFISPAFAAAKARFEAERLGMGREAARAHRAEAVARASAETLLFVAVSTNDPYWNDLDRSDGSLRARLRLADGTNLAPTSVEQLSSDAEADVRPFFPYLDPLYEAYWVRFPLPQDRDALRLRIAGAPAVVDLIWEAP